MSRTRRVPVVVAVLVSVLIAGLAAAPSPAAPGYAIEGLRIRQPVGAFGSTPLGTCDLVTLAGCETKTFSVDNVGSRTIFIGGYGIADLDPLTAALVPLAGGCDALPLVEGFWALRPGSSCLIGVAFSAPERGRTENELRIWYTDQSSPIAVVPLFGVGTKGPGSTG